MVHHEHHGRVTLAVIDRPARRNAVDHATLIALAEIVESCVHDGSRALVVTGSGGAFSAGADLSGVEGDEFHAALRRVLDGLSTLPIVTIAAVDGVALGAGTQLAVACDLRTATAESRFGIPAARLGLMIDQWTADRLSVLLGSSMARAMLLAAETIDGTTAARLGFVHR
ncbi:MAG: enoyl-CoA hydratase-related protein, partial [Acidimicrobiia bacterium]